MAGWFAKLMQKRRVRSPRAFSRAGIQKHEDATGNLDTRDARHDAVVQMLRERDVPDREAREKRQRGYRQTLESETGAGSGASSPQPPVRLHKFHTKVPCRATPEARALLDELRTRFSGGAITFAQITKRKQAVMLTGGAGAVPRQIGWVEHCVQTDPKLCNVRDQGLVVGTDGGRMLVLRFLYPPTAVRMSSRRDAQAEASPHIAGRIDARGSRPQRADGLALAAGALDEATFVDFAEIRPALDLRASERSASPRLVWVTRPEVDTFDALRSRDYEAFYVRFKRELLAGIWSSLTSALSSSPGSQWHRGSHYTVVREPDATNGRIHQRTVDDSGRVVDIGSDRIYSAAPATDILLLYLEGDVLADFAEIYFTLHTLDSADAWFVKEEFFTVVRRFWASAPSLASRYGSDFAAVERMSQRALPTPAQAPLLKQDWIDLRQCLVDRYGERGRKAADLVGADVHRPGTGRNAWSFASYPAGEVNVGLRVVYRQEWRHLGVQRGEIIRSVPRVPAEAEAASVATAGSRVPRGAEDVQIVETTVQQSETARSLDEIVDEAARATIAAMKWPVDHDGSINTGARALAVRTDMGLESEYRESSRDTSARLSDVMLRMASRIGDGTRAEASSEKVTRPESPSPSDVECSVDDDAATHVYSRLQNRYEVLTRAAEIQNVVLVAEKLPAPAEIDVAWVRRHASVLTQVLLDGSFRDVLDSIGQEAPSAESPVSAPDPDGPRAEDIDHGELAATRERLYQHLRDNVLHYQRALWRQEDPQQRSLRYRRSGTTVPLEWRFELESGAALTIDELGDRLGAAHVDGLFATYSSGRQAHLDQVIDPAGPIGYYGNYAVYQMRPEFGSAELFSMLHFFKSPHLRADPETGAPEVEDPEHIGITANPAVVGVSDRTIAEHRDEMFQYVPELRLEVARAWQQVSDGTDPRAVDRLQRHSTTLLRRHFAAYLFRRERARRIALDADGVVFDVVRRATTAPERSEYSHAWMDVADAPEDYELILDGAREPELLSVNACRGAQAGWAILGGGEAQAIGLRAGGAPDADTEQSIFAREDGGARLTAVGGAGAAAARDPSIHARRDAERTPGLRTGRAHDPDAERVLVGRDDRPLRFAASGGGEVIAPHELAIRVEGEAGSSPRLSAGPSHAADAGRMIIAGGGDGMRLAAVGGVEPARPDEQLIPAAGEGERMPSLFAGAGAPHAHETLLLARDDGEPSLTAVSGGGSVQDQEQVILSGGDEERTPSLRTGRAHDPDAERVVAAREDGELRLTAIASTGAGRGHERLILARDDNEWLRPSLIAG